MTKEEKNRMAVRAMAVACFKAPIREGETYDDAMDSIVAKMEGSWPAQAAKIKEVVHKDGASA